jgi:hypothetical protein
MRRKIVISALAVVILLSISCGGGGGLESPISPAAITGDNLGGAIAFYQTWRMSDTGSHVGFYAQKISPEGDFLWGEKGILIGSGDALLLRTCGLYAVSDGSGGAVVIWSEPPHVAKIDSGGNVEWQTDIPSIQEAIKEVIPDGSGGVIIAYIDGNGSISVLKIDAEGNRPWGEDGVSLNLGDSYLSDIASDNLGGVIVVRYGYGNISAQRVDSGGNILWQTGGVRVCVSPAEEAQVVSDGSSGAIIAFDYGSDIYAQRIDAEGNVLWGPDGVPICVGPSLKHSPGIVDDGAGGAIVFFVSIENDYPAIHARRIDADGHKLWNEDVVLLPTTYNALVSDGSGGAITVGYSRDGTSGEAQRLDATGRELWGPEGTALTFHDLQSPLAAPDGCGGVLISWAAVKFTGDEVSQVSYYVQRVDAEGDVVWGDEGILLDP